MAVDLEILRPGMQVQLARRRDAIAKGMTPRGWKIGLNVAAVQAHFGLQGPCVGWLDGRRILASGAVVDFLPEVAMRVEPEVCLRVGAGGRLESIAPALEIVDFTTPPKGLFELLSSSILHVATIVGEFVSPERGVELGTRWPRLEVTGQPTPPLGDGLVHVDLIRGRLRTRRAGSLRRSARPRRPDHCRLVCGGRTAPRARREGGGGFRSARLGVRHATGLIATCVAPPSGS